MLGLKGIEFTGMTPVSLNYRKAAEISLNSLNLPPEQHRRLELDLNKVYEDYTDTMSRFAEGRRQQRFRTCLGR